MSSNKFSPLQLDKKTVAKLNDEQLRKVRGGHHAKADATNFTDCIAGVTYKCIKAGSTVVQKSQAPEPKDGQSPVTHL